MRIPGTASMCTTFTPPAKGSPSMAAPTRNGERTGFTLIELLLVLLLVALLASIVGPTVTAGLQRSRESTLKHDLRVMRQAMDDYYGDNGRYPAALEDLV